MNKSLSNEERKTSAESIESGQKKSRNYFKMFKKTGKSMRISPARLQNVSEVLMCSFQILFFSEILLSQIRLRSEWVGLKISINYIKEDLIILAKGSIPNC